MLDHYFGIEDLEVLEVVGVDLFVDFFSDDVGLLEWE